MNFWDFLLQNRQELQQQLLEHIGLTFLSLTLAIVIAVPAGIGITRRRSWAAAALGIAGIFQTVPSLALLGFLIPTLGIGVKPSIVVLLIYALLPILRNTYTGIQGVDAAVKEAACGMGMSPWQVLAKVELPLALPFIFAGIRTATVINVGVATLAAYIGAGGLGEFIFGGIALNNAHMILAGAIFAALLAILFDQLLAQLGRLPLRRMRRTALGFALALPLPALLYFLPQWSSSGLRIGFDPEFGGRADGYPKLAEAYDLHLNTKILNAGLMYRAVAEGAVDVISGYSTDGRIKAYDLAVLEDDKKVFPPYHCAPLIRQNLAEAHPELVEALNLLAGKISDSIMTLLNYRVDFQQEKPAAVAEDFLKQLELWKPDRRQGGQRLVIGSKVFTEQYILAHLFAQLIEGFTDFDTSIKTGLGGTKICFEALRKGGIDLYPEYTGTGLLVLLSVPEAEAARYMTDAAELYQYVSTVFANEYGLTWLLPLGFNNTYALMLRQKDAYTLGVRTISDLGRLRRR